MNMSELENKKINTYDVKSQLRDYVYQRSFKAFEAGDLARDQIENVEQLNERRVYMRTKLIEAFGGLPPSDAPLNPQVTGTVQYEGYKVEKIMFESRPGHIVTTNMYIPNDVTAPRGTVLFVCGHSDIGKHSPVYQTVCQYLVQAGLVVLSMDPLGQGERLSYFDTSTLLSVTSEHDYVGSQCWPLGDSLARYFIHDIMRAIDYLCTREEVDASKIGITGSSGGGTQSSMAMVCDDRIAAAAPGTFIMSRAAYILAGAAQDAEQIWPGMSALGFDHEDILMGMAPRPVLVLAATEDFFPIEGTRRTVARVRRFWEMQGKGDCIGLKEDVSIHRYTETLARAAATFFAKHLLNRDVNVEEAPIELRAPEELQCTVSGQVKVDFPHAKIVHHENVRRLDELEKARNAIPPEIRMQRARAWLKEKVYASRTIDDLNPRYHDVGLLNEEQLQVRRIFWRTHDDIFNHALEFREVSQVDHHLPVTVALWEEGTSNLLEHSAWIKAECANLRAVLVIDVTGSGAITPHPLAGAIRGRFGGMYKLTTDLFWLDDSLAAVRTFDVLKALELAHILKQGDPQDVRIYAQGRFSIYAQLASLLDESKHEIELVDELKSVGEWVGSYEYENNNISEFILPGMIKHFDLTDIRK